MQNEQAAIQLGKALFWDMSVGSDGITACASCHFLAGADNRSKNQVNPGLNRVNGSLQPNPDRRFTIRPNQQLTASDFPLRKLADVNNRTSAVVADTNDVIGSQGVFNSTFLSNRSNNSRENLRIVRDPDGFHVNNTVVRRVTGRNTSSVINAVYNFRNFWDGRAQNDFNGVNEFGSRDPNAFLFKAAGGTLVATRISLENSSLASQALGPPLNTTEMSGKGRNFRHLARKLLIIKPLRSQIVHPQDSVLGRLSRSPSPGLRVGAYAPMVRAAFKREWWDSTKFIRVLADGSTQVVDAATSPADFKLIEYNFSLFFGLALQMYQATLVANDSPFDRFQEGNTTALTAAQKRGFNIFRNTGNCLLCHGGPELTDASVRKVKENRLRRRKGTLDGQELTNIVDNGFFNLGIRPTTEDIGLGGNDPFGNPLSEARLALLGKFTDPRLSPALNRSRDVLAVDGAFKIPGLRNVELTAPYFHNGGQGTLRQVIDFYFRGGDIQPITGFDAQRQNPTKMLSLAILTGPLFNPSSRRSTPMSEQDKQDLEAFLKSLTDERVRKQQAPFDHPQLFIPNGQTGDQFNVQVTASRTARDAMIELPAVGRGGGTPLSKFLQ